jgi:hypothetical protein
MTRFAAAAMSWTVCARAGVKAEIKPFLPYDAHGIACLPDTNYTQIRRYPDWLASSAGISPAAGRTLSTTSFRICTVPGFAPGGLVT